MPRTTRAALRAAVYRLLQELAGQEIQEVAERIMTNEAVVVITIAPIRWSASDTENAWRRLAEVAEANMVRIQQARPHLTPTEEAALAAMDAEVPHKAQWLARKAGVPCNSYFRERLTKLVRLKLAKRAEDGRGYLRG